jgi:hypothetical protein
VTTLTQTERNTLAAAHELIAATPGIDRTRLSQDSRIGGRAWWAVEQLLARGMIVALVGNPGCVDVRYATVRAAKEVK